MIPFPTRRAVMLRADNRCECCGERADLFKGIRLELHHLRYLTEPSNYEPCGEPIDGKEEPEDLLALCRDCHEAHHRDRNGDFWKNPNEMANP